MSDYQLRRLLESGDRGRVAMAFIGLGATALIGGITAGLGLYELSALSLVALLAPLESLDRLDSIAREEEPVEV